MLRIEKVFLQGFKSFNDPTELVFDPEGITAVVGPNGCGKSNVADALSWVIGEQRAKALRGGKMEDVIFQGSRNRKPSGLAEVILTMRVYESFEIRSQEKEPTPTPLIQTEPETSQQIGDSTPTSKTSARQSEPEAALKFSPRVFQEGERITVARRLYRTGESEYEMNGRTCRLRDIQDLFAGTGLGGAHYAIIEQGRIGQVLSAKPLDRRALIEEAAGISKFKMRQRTSELKLEAAKQNLSRVTDIIAEVERQQNSLKRQAAKARRYQRLRQEMRDLMKAVFVADYQATHQVLAEMEAQKQEINQRETENAALLAQAEALRQATNAQVHSAEESLTQARELAAQTNLALEKARQQETYYQEQITALQLRSAQFSHDQGAIGERGRLTTQELTRLREELLVIEQEMNSEANSLSQVEASYLQQATQDDQVEKELERKQRSVTEAATQHERWKQLGQQFLDAVERANRSLSGLTLERQRAAEQASRSAEELEATEQRVFQIEEEQSNLRVQQNVIGALVQQKTNATHELERAFQETQKILTTTDQRLKSLVELDEKRAYFSEPVQAIIQAAKHPSNHSSFNILGTLADQIKVNPQDEVIVEIGLKEELQYLITPSFDDAVRAIEFLKREKLGRATFLVLNPHPIAHRTDPESGSSIMRLIDLLGIKPEFRGILQQALPRLSQTVIAQELQQAISDSISANGKGSSFLTASGEMVSAGHIISGGSSLQQGSGILALKREIERLQMELAERTEQQTNLEEQREIARAELQEAILQNRALDERLRELEKALALQQGLQQQGTREKERAATHLRVVEKEIVQAEQELAEVTDKLHHAKTQLQQAEETLATVQQAAAEAQEAVIEIRRLAAERTQELSSRRADFAAKSERRKGLQNDIKRLENESTDIVRRLNRAQMEALETEERSMQLSSALATLREEIEMLRGGMQTQAEQVEVSQANLMSQKETLAENEQTLTQLRETISQLREARTEIDITRAKQLAHLEHLEASCFTELGESIADLIAKSSEAGDNVQVQAKSVNVFDEEEGEFDELASPSVNLSSNFDLNVAQAHLQELRAKVEAIGPVNLLALEELGEAEERLGFLLEQKADIEQAVTDTLAVITELKRRSRDRFVEAFHQINQNFSAMFLELFGGGHGEMRLIDETDVLESGIDLIAQPPGKRLQNVLLLSGGEKAMAALALIMGIFKYRPSPFCLLDEVDAPLDDVNIGRFADKVLEMSQNTQFLVITHSKRTMEAAKTMYGVTMEDPGVSKLISVRLT
jgi:chromosome segregation protein